MKDWLITTLFFVSITGLFLAHWTPLGWAIGGSAGAGMILGFLHNLLTPDPPIKKEKSE